MSSFSERSEGSRGPIEARPGLPEISFGDLGSSLSLPGLEAAVSLGLVTNTAELKKNLTFAFNLGETPQPGAVCELAWRFSRFATSETSQHLALALCREIDPKGVFTHVDLEQKILREAGRDISLQKRVHILFDLISPEVPFSERNLALDQLEEIMCGRIRADQEQSITNLRGAIFGQGVPSRSNGEYLDKIDRLVQLTRDDSLKGLLMLIKERDLPPISPTISDPVRQNGRVLGDNRVPSSSQVPVVGLARNARDLELVIEGAYWLLGQPVRSLSAKIMATGAIESQWSGSPEAVELCRELRADLVERWFTPGRLYSVTELKELMFPSDYPLPVQPRERLERIDDLIRRAKSEATIRLALLVRAEILPKQNPEFKLRGPGNLEVLLFTDDRGSWREDLTTRRKFELISNFIDSPEGRSSAALARQLRAQMLDARQPDIAPNKEILERLLFGEGAKFVSAKVYRETLLDLRKNCANSRVKEICAELIEGVDLEQKSFWSRIRRSAPVAAAYRWLNRD